MPGEGAGGCVVIMILAGDMDYIWRLGLPGWDGRWTSLVGILLRLEGSDIQNLYIEHHHENYNSFLW